MVNSEFTMSILNRFYMVENFNAQPYQFDVEKPFLFRDGGSVGG